MTKLDLRYILEETQKSAYNGHSVEKLKEWKNLLRSLDKLDRRSLKNAMSILEIIIKLKEKKGRASIFKQFFLFAVFVTLIFSIQATLNYNVGGSIRLTISDEISRFIGQVENVDNFNGVSRFLELNINNGTNAIAGFTATNNLNRSIIIGITGGNFSVASPLLVDDQPFIFSNAGNDMAFGVGSANGFVWRNDLIGAEQYANTTNILMTLNSLGDLNITNNLNVTANATIQGFLSIGSLEAVSPGQSTLLRIDDATGTVGTVGGSLVVINTIDSPTPTSGVNYVWDLGSGNNLTVDLHSSLDPDDPLSVISHYFNLVKGHIWRLNPNNNNSFFQWESGADNALFTIRGNGSLNLNDSIIIAPNGSITFPEVANCDTIQSDVSGLLSCGTGGFNVSTLSLLSVFKNGTQATTASFANLTDWTEDIVDTPYSFNSTSGVITFNEDGRYLVSVDARINGIADGRSTLFIRMAEDFGSGFIFDTRNVWSNYATRNIANSEGGVGGVYIKDYSIGDKIQLQVRVSDTQRDINTNDSRIYIIKMQGTKGDPGINGLNGTNGINGLNGTNGINGSTGATGATGAGSNIIVQKDNVTIGIVTDTLNFEGTGVSAVIDVGNNKTTVTISGGGGIFGSEFEKFESLGQSDTGASFTTKLSATTASKPAGTYRIGFTVDATNSDGTDIYKVRFSIDGVPIHQHTNGNDEYENKPNGNNDWEVYSTFSYLTLGSPATIDLLIEFGTNDNIARASNAAIEIWRVS